MCQICKMVEGVVRELDFSSGVLIVCDKYATGITRICKRCLSEVKLTDEEEQSVLEELSLDKSIAYIFMIDSCVNCDSDELIPQGGEYFGITEKQAVNRQSI
ncbi:hypothetical protein HQ571_02135 [Candidatus Kuenenbacteria bacterium]|nr:hypothetical protein [Candidatus Kuenenbacteria bacterium]